MSKLRVYEVARDLGLENKALVALFQAIGVTDVRNHMSAVAPEQIERVKRHMEKQSAESVVEERIHATVVKRRAVKPRSEAASSPVAAPLRSAPAAAPPPVSSPRSAPVPEPPPVVIAREASAPAAAPPPPPSVVEARSEPKAAPPPPAPVVEAAPPPPAPVVEPPPAPKSEARPPEPPPPPPPPPPVVEAPRMPSTPPKTGVEVWQGRPGVPMPQAPRGAPPPRRVQYDAKAGGGPGGGPQRRGGPMMGGGRPGQRGPGGPRGGRFGGPVGQPLRRSTGPVIPAQERAAHKKVVRIEGTVLLQTLAGRLGVKATEMLMKLMQLGMTGVNINSTLDADTAKIVANEFGWEVEDTAVSEEQALEEAQGVAKAVAEEGREPRPPVVTVMGHVDHGKTSLLDQIRKANVAAGEAGGITQHIGAYSVDTPRGKITFLDTPGHEAFTQMRARGAQATDIVILVVAADDGVMPQTKEAISHAKAAEVPIVVAINKIDKPQAQPDRVRRELADVGLVPEEWGGDTLFCEVSAVTRAGVDHLLESVALQAELLDLRANPKNPAQGLVVEAELDRGRGPVASVLIMDGTLERGDVILAGSAWGKVRAMIDDRGRSIAAAGPSTPVSIIGLNEVPSAGDPVHVIRDAKKAQEIAEGRQSKQRKSLLPSATKVSLEELARAMAEAAQLDLKVIVKADVQGSVEAVSDALLRLSTDKVKVTIVHAGVGAITEGDVNLAVAAKAIVVGFNVRPAGKASSLAQKENVEIRQYSIIYDVVDDVKKAMEGLLAPTLVENVIGHAEVRQLFKLSKAGWVAGCMVTQGVVRRNAHARIQRDGNVVWTGKIAALRRFKDDVKEVKEGFDCGLSFEGWNEMKEKDVVEVFEMQEVRQSL
ncbi:MAG TPA: translation initiation factor IF-2 [Polyangiaceae bacterium]|nr:translation initiation factor IF-2 [Polyangiaceae bacterium]